MPQSAKTVLQSLIVCGLLAGSPAWVHGMDGPDSVELASLVNLYEAVTFDHAMHAETAACAVCHHHTTGGAVEDEKCLPCHARSDATDEVACSSCHAGAGDSAGQRLEAAEDGRVFHRERTGLKRAYHLKCLVCHLESGAASGCEDCHPKRQGAGRLAQHEKEK